MKSSLLLSLATLGALALPLFPSREAGATPAPQPAEPAAAPVAYAIDGVHSSIVFRIKHNDAAWFYGRFDQISGELLFDEADPSKSSVKVVVTADSVNTGNAKRDQHVKSPDFFDAKQFPELTFQSTEVSRDGGMWKVKGTLDFHGVKKEVAVEFEKTGEGEGRGGAKLIGFHGTFSIRRSAFGMDFMMGGLGDQVDLTVSLEAAAK